MIDGGEMHQSDPSQPTQVNNTLCIPQIVSTQYMFTLYIIQFLNNKKKIKGLLCLFVGLQNLTKIVIISIYL